MKKEYRCCICHRKLDYKPIRLVKQLHDNKETYGAYHHVTNYDFCTRCYTKIDEWIDKYKR